MKTVIGTNQLCRDTQAIARPAHGTLDNILDAQHFGNLLDRNILALERKRRGAGRNEQFGKLTGHDVAMQVRPFVRMSRQNEFATSFTLVEHLSPEYGLEFRINW